jgi:hypothetical protein
MQTLKQRRAHGVRSKLLEELMMRYCLADHTLSEKQENNDFKLTKVSATINSDKKRGELEESSRCIFVMAVIS